MLLTNHANHILCTNEIFRTKDVVLRRTVTYKFPHFTLFFMSIALDEVYSVIKIYTHWPLLPWSKILFNSSYTEYVTPVIKSSRWLVKITDSV